MAFLSPLFNDQTPIPGTSTPAFGYKLFTYIAGSSTKQTTYTDAAGTVPHTNPIVLNSSGWPTMGPIWLAAGSTTKFVLTGPTDADPPTSPVKTFDNVQGVNDPSAAASNQWQPSGVTPTYVTANTFTLIGDQTTNFHAGRRLQFTTSAGTVYGSIGSSVFGAVSTVTMDMDGTSVLDVGLTVVNVSILRGDNSALPVINYNMTSINDHAIASVVDSIAVLRLLDKTKHTRALVSGYYAPGDGGGGAYWYDSTDTISADNGGTIIVATDGGRWKLIRNGRIDVKQFGAKVDGVTNDTTAVQAALTWLGANGGGFVDIPAGTCCTNVVLSIPSKVTLRGAGGGENWATGAGVAWGTSPTFATRLLWIGGYVSANIILLADTTFDNGVSDIHIDGGLSVANITAWQADFNAAANLEPTLFGIRSRSNLRPKLNRVSIQNVNVGLFMDTSAGHVNGFGVHDTVAILTCNIGIRMLGLSTAAIANQSFTNLTIIGYYNRGVDFIAWTDSNAFHNVYFATSIVPSVMIWYNSELPGADNGVGFNNFLNVITDLNNPSVADNGMRSVVCGYTAPGYSYMTGFISGTNVHPSLYPEIRANGLFLWTQATAPSYTCSEHTLWAGGAKVGNIAAAWNTLDEGAVTFWNANHWNSLYSTAALVANFKPASKIVRVDLVVYWNPGSATGGVRLFNDGTASVLGTAIVPGAAAAIESMQDVTDAFLKVAAGATPNYVTPNDFRIRLQTFGSGAVGPTIYKSFLRVVTSDFV